MTLCQQVPFHSLTGLQVKIKNKPLKAYTYALATDTESIIPVKRKVLVNDNEVQGDHVLVHKLEPAQKLSEVIANYRTHKYTKAVVVVNTVTSHMLEPVYLEGFEGGNFPVLIVSSTDGRELLDIIEHEEEAVLCDIEVESAVDAPSQHTSNHHYPHQLPVTEQPRAGGGKSNTNLQDNKSTGMYTVTCTYIQWNLSNMDAFEANSSLRSVHQGYISVALCVCLGDYFYSAEMCTCIKFALHTAMFTVYFALRYTCIYCLVAPFKLLLQEVICGLKGKTSNVGARDRKFNPQHV